jgi:hypothetical protein
MEQHVTEEDERRALTAADFAAAGVEPPNWAADPIPSLETWRRWRVAEERALAHKRRAEQQALPQNALNADMHALHD